MFERLIHLSSCYRDILVDNRANTALDSLVVQYMFSILRLIEASLSEYMLAA
jgi:hypothetical protein